jgi:hypothetical protein
MLDTRRDCGSHNIVGILAKRAIRMFGSVLVDVRKLEGGAKKKNDRKKRNEEVSYLPAAQP